MWTLMCQVSITQGLNNKLLFLDIFSSKVKIKQKCWFNGNLLVEQMQSFLFIVFLL